ncbi:hypothetical protein MTR_8g465220 [Medicago truncatula]|uniref:Uncharacterized protein n=1 Tax=Medicago truncatula TaxID=3880 RepID=A0A072TQ35_MEDTR|nr:hypothetical protein MTR_8g465220 [Medicago truncatula]
MASTATREASDELAHSPWRAQLLARRAMNFCTGRKLAVLHTGDFRYSEEMANNPLLQTCPIHTLILDTTYCNPQINLVKFLAPLPESFAI